MFIDFLSRAEAVFDRDARDLSALCDELNTESAFVGFMPAVTFDLWPIYSLGCTRISRFTGSNAMPKIYLMPAAVSDCFIYHSLRETVRSFFSEDETAKIEAPKEKEGFFAALFKKKGAEETARDLLYGIRIEEIILLNHPALADGAPLVFSPKCECNSVYMRLSLPNGSTAYLFVLCSTPEDAWRSVIERFNIPTEMIIHSHKGFGHWFTSTTLYEHLLSTRYPHLLPRFYFRGKYISTDDAPPASVESDRIVDEFTNTENIIYRLPDKLQ